MPCRMTQVEDATRDGLASAFRRFERALELREKLDRGVRQVRAPIFAIRALVGFARRAPFR